MYSWETGWVRAIRFFESRSAAKFALTLTLSHEYMGEGTGEIAEHITSKAHVIQTLFRCLSLSATPR